MKKMKCFLSTVPDAVFRLLSLLSIFWVKQDPGRGPEQRESDKTVLYLPIVINILISYIIIKLLMKRRIIPKPEMEL